MKRLLPTLLGRRRGKGTHALSLCISLCVSSPNREKKKKVLPPTATKLPTGGRRADGSQGLNVAGAAPHVLPDTLNPEQVAARTLQAVWCKGWDQGPTVKAAAVTAKQTRVKPSPQPQASPGSTSQLPPSISKLLSAREAHSFGFQKPLLPSSGFTTAPHPEAGLSGKRQLLRRCSSQQHQRGRWPALPATG